MKNTFKNFLFNVSLFVAHEEMKYSDHRLINGKKFRTHERTLYIFDIPVKTVYRSEVL